MKRLSMLIVFLAICNLLFAQFSKFEIINYGNLNESRTDDVIPRIAIENNIVAIEIPISNMDTEKMFWLVIGKTRLPESKLVFRKSIWRNSFDQDTIDSIVPLGIRTVSYVENKVEKTRHAIELRISRETAKRSYIYYDFPFQVFDGGFYYTIDLPDIVEKQKK